MEDRTGRVQEPAATYVPPNADDDYLHTAAARPPVDQYAGSEASAEAAQARREIEAQLADGSLSLADVFEMNDQESGDSERIVGHMHIRAALLALKGIGDVKADAILAEVGIEGDRHIASLGSKQQAELAAAADAA
jgi:hypothetical protein